MAAIKQERFTALADLADDGHEFIATDGPAVARLTQMGDFYFPGQGNARPARPLGVATNPGPPPAG